MRLDNYLPDAESLGPCENPVPRSAAAVSVPTDRVASGSMQSFSFETSQVVLKLYEYRPYPN